MRETERGQILVNGRGCGKPAHTSRVSVLVAHLLLHLLVGQRLQERAPDPNIALVPEQKKELNNKIYI